MSLGGMPSGLRASCIRQAQVYRRVLRQVLLRHKAAFRPWLKAIYSSST